MVVWSGQYLAVGQRPARGGAAIIVIVLRERAREKEDGQQHWRRKTEDVERGAPGKTPAACFHAADEQDQRRRNERPDREDCHHIAECRPPRLRRSAKEAEDIGLAGEKERRQCQSDQTHAREQRSEEPTYELQSLMHISFTD